MYFEIDFDVAKLIAIVMLFAIYGKVMIKIFGKEEK